MPHHVQICRRIALPEPVRVARCLRAPELGPRILFFSGGSALRPTSRVLKQYTHNSIHLITPFDSGGSSASLRDAFGMLSVGDLRNRLLALADESVLGNPEIYALFSHRLSKSVDPIELGARLTRMIKGQDPLVAAVPQPMQQIVRTYLRLFARRMPPGFDLRGASVGNLLVSGGYLSHNRDIDSVTFLFSQLLEVRGTVRAIVDADLHLAAELEDGRQVVGQKMLTGKEVPPITSPIASQRLVEATRDVDGHRERVAQRVITADEAPSPPLPPDATVGIAESMADLIRSADAIVYPMGSFYTSLLANLLPHGVGRAITEAGCPRIFIPNTAADPESLGRTQASLLETLIETVRADASADTPVDEIVNLVLVDPDRSIYDATLDLDALRAQGVRIAEVPLTTPESSPLIDATRLTEVLVSLG